MWLGWVAVSRAILDRKLEKKNYKGPCRVKKNSRHPKNIWIEPTPPTHPLPNFFVGEPISSKILIFWGVFQFTIQNCLDPNTHPPTHFKIVFQCLDFLNFATSLQQYQHYIQIKKKQTTGLYYLIIYLLIQPSLHEEIHIKLNMQEH